MLTSQIWHRLGYVLLRISCLFIVFWWRVTSMFRINLINLQKPTCQFLKITAGTERVFARWTAGMQKYILHTPAYATTLIFARAHLMGRKLRRGSGCEWQPRQGIATPPLPHADEMCFAAKLCSFRQEIMCTFFRILKKANENVPGFVFLSFWPQQWLKGGLLVLLSDLD